MNARDFLNSNFEPASFEASIYQRWLDQKCFYASDESAAGQESFCIVIPPPNVTGALHMGHALTNTIQDVLIRWKRMSGYNALWLPGTDHAGIATQNQVEKQIAKEGTDRHKMGREAFVERVWAWKHEHHSKIKNQLSKLGSSLDWERERFTLDDGLSQAVRKVFVSLHKKGLIYRANRLINWCVRCQTALSDLEVVPTERNSRIYKLRYPIRKKGSNDATTSLVVATTRPETILGDMALAVHPEDERYAEFSRDYEAVVPFLNRPIPILNDSYVDQAFGSGVLKITPGHDFNDHEVATRHKLASISCFDPNGILNAETGSYQGLTIAQARKKIVEDLEAIGLLESVEDHKNQVGLCQRCDTVAEPMLSLQWFVDTKPLAQRALEVVRNKQIIFKPEAWEKTYYEWMENIRDWCISRQLWWGHQIPAWTCQHCNHIHVEESAPTACEKCGHKSLVQDPDVLDTWFSSALWPFSTLGWPEKTAALKTFYPTSILETGFDILFFWVARMIMMGLECTGEIPFHRVYLHAMVRDEKGEKMSKSKGNVIDPLEVTGKYGADALRFTLAMMAGQGRDVKLSLDRVEGYKAFGNKLWNASKFILMNAIDDLDSGKLNNPLSLSLYQEVCKDAEKSAKFFPHHWLIDRLFEVASEVNTALDSFELDRASQEIYRFVWNDLCDWFVEISKVYLKSDDTARKATQEVSLYVLDQTLRLVHPFMPFLTEQIWTSLPTAAPQNVKHREKDGMSSVETLMFCAFPNQKKRPFENANMKSKSASDMGLLKKIVESIRNFRGENNLSPKIGFKVTFESEAQNVCTFIERNHELLKALTKVDEFYGEKLEATPGNPVTKLAMPEHQLSLSIALKGLVNFEEEQKRLQKEIEKVAKDIEHFQKKLSSPAFVEKAPKALVDAEKAKLLTAEQKRDDLIHTLKRFSTV